MNEGIRMGEAKDAQGRIVPIHDDAFVGQPVIGMLIGMEDGVYAITDRDECTKFDSRELAIGFITNKWRRS
jgi:hypothetical protein